MAKPKSNVNGPQWRVQWKRFTKDDARRELAKPVREDRPTDESWKSALVRTMDLGLWNTYSPAQVPIAYDSDGFRVNGKHRLQAFAESSLHEIIFPVAYNCRPEDFRLFDQNQKVRQHRHAHPDRSNVARDEARINWVELIVSADTSVKVTTPVFGALAEGKWRKQLEWASETIPKSGAQGKAPYVAALMYVHRVDPVFADKIGKAWANGGEGLPKQVLRIRDTALTTKNSKGTRGCRTGYSTKLLHALACMHAGKPIPERMNDTQLAGLRYWSERQRDGAITRWEKKNIFAGSGEA